MKNEKVLYLGTSIKIKHNNKGFLYLDNFEVFLKKKTKFENKSKFEIPNIIFFPVSCSEKSS